MSEDHLSLKPNVKPQPARNGEAQKSSSHYYIRIC